MRDAIAEVESALKASGMPSPWSDDIKASDEFLDPVFASYFRRLNLPNLMAKKNYDELPSTFPRSKSTRRFRRNSTQLRLSQKSRHLGVDGREPDSIQ